MGFQAAFADDCSIGRDQPGELFGGGDVGDQGLEIAVVDADQPGLEPQRAIEFGRVVRLDQHVHAEPHGNRFEFRGLGVGQHRHDQQHAIGAHRPAFVDLPGVEHEILAQGGQGAAGAGGGEIGFGAVEVGQVSQHRQAGGAAGLVGGGQFSGVEVRPNGTAGGRGALDFGDQAHPAGGDFTIEGGGETAGWRQGGDAGFQRSQRQVGLAARGFCGGVGANPCQNVGDVGHAVALRSASRAASAAPESIDLAAIFTPLRKFSARPATMSAPAALSSTVSR